MPVQTRTQPAPRTGALFWGAVAAACVLVLGSGWILVSGEWGPADPESDSWRIRTALAVGLALIVLVLLLLDSKRRRGEPSPRVEPATTPWWTDPLGAASADAVLTFDDQMLIRSANNGAEEFFGYPARELAGQSLFRLIPATERFSGAALLEDTTDRKGVALELTARRQDGSEVPVELRVTRFERGSRAMYLAVCREQQRPERAETPRVEGTDRLIVHLGKEIDNAVTTILGYSNVVLGALPAEHQNRGDLNAIGAAGQRLARLSQVLQVVGRTPAKRGEEIDIHEWLRGLVEVEAGNGGEFSGVPLSLEAADPVVRVETSYLRVVLARLIKLGNEEGESNAEMEIRTVSPPEGAGGILSLEITRPAPVPEIDRLTYELARGIAAKTGCGLDARQEPESRICFVVSIPRARS